MNVKGRVASNSTGMEKGCHVAFLVRTSGLSYDDRVRKEALDLERMGFSVSIYAAEFSNEERHFIPYGNVEATALRIRTRQWAPLGGMLWLKALELYGRFLEKVVVNRPDAIWCHDPELAGLIPLFHLWRRTGRIQRLVWDQHELPRKRVVLENPMAKSVFAYLMNMCDAVCVANEARRDLLRRRLGERLQVPLRVIHNYPDATFAQRARHRLPQEVENWLDGTPYLLAQGGGSERRHMDELTAAVCASEQAKLIFVGPYEEKDVRRLRRLHGASLDKWVLFTGLVPQIDLIPFIDHAQASVALYRSHTLNNKLCAPNKVYQALVRGIPVIVSSANPTMVEIVRQHGCGLVADPTPAGLRRGIEELLPDTVHYRKNAEKASGNFLWHLELEALRAAALGVCE